MKNWSAHFQALSSEHTASFGAPGLEVTTSPTPKRTWSFDLDSVPRPMFVALVAAGVAVVAAASYSLGQAYEYDRHAGHREPVKREPVKRGHSGVRRRHVGSLKGLALYEALRRREVAEARTARAS